MIQYCLLNNQLVSTEESHIKINDLAILRGYGIFDYFLFRDGHPLFLEDYLNRFINSAKLLNLELPQSKAQLKTNIYNLIKANQIPDGAMRLVATGGYSLDGYTPTTPNLMVLQYASPNYPETYYTEGVRLLSHAYQREIPRAKTINYLMGITAIPKLKAAQAIEVLYHDGQFLRETVRANFFLVNSEGKLITPAENILLGITRKTVLEVARQVMVVEEREVAVEELQTAKEAFLTSSTRGVMPVTKVDDLIIGNGKPGPYTQMLIVETKKAQGNYISAQEPMLKGQS